MSRGVLEKVRQITQKIQIRSKSKTLEAGGFLSNEVLCPKNLGTHALSTVEKEKGGKNGG